MANIEEEDKPSESVVCPLCNQKCTDYEDCPARNRRRPVKPVMIRTIGGRGHQHSFSMSTLEHDQIPS